MDNSINIRVGFEKIIGKSIIICTFSNPASKKKTMNENNRTFYFLFSTPYTSPYQYLASHKVPDISTQNPVKYFGELIFENYQHQCFQSLKLEHLET